MYFQITKELATILIRDYEGFIEKSNTEGDYYRFLESNNAEFGLCNYVYRNFRNTYAIGNDPVIRGSIPEGKNYLWLIPSPYYSVPDNVSYLQYRVDWLKDHFHKFPNEKGLL